MVEQGTVEPPTEQTHQVEAVTVMPLTEVAAFVAAEAMAAVSLEFPSEVP